MPQSIYARAAARGFPVFDFSGQTGQGALQDATAKPPAAGLPAAPWTNPNNDPASVPAQLPPPEAYVLPAPLWGLPASPNPDTTPKPADPTGPYWDPGQGHAGPAADPALLAAGISEGTHGPVFNGAQLRDVASGHALTGAVTQMDQSRTGGQGSTADTLQPLTGQIRHMGGFDAVQGYGGGGPGPGGVNTPQGPTTDQMAFGGTVYKAASFLNAAEVPFLVAEPAQFIATAPEFPPYMPTFDVPTAAVTAQQPIPADTPALGPALAPGPAVAYAGLPWG